MRTGADLQGAFALLERTAEAYAHQHDADVGVHTDADADAAVVMELVHPGTSARAHRHRARMRLAAGLAAAAAVAGVAVIVGHPGGGTGHDSPAASGGGATFDLRTVPFSVKRGSGFTVTNLHIDETSVTADLYSRTQHFQFGLSPADASTHPTRGVQVDINGKRGYYTAGGTPAISEPGDGNGTDAPSDHPSGSYARAVTWEFQPNSWALLTSQGMPDLGKIDLLRAARALQFGDSAVTMRLPLRLKRAPLGGRLQRVFAAPGIVDSEKPPFRLTAHPSQTEVQYATGGGNFLRVVLTTGTSWETTGTRTTVAGRGAYYDKKSHSLTVDEGNRCYVEVRAEHDDPEPGTLSRVTLQELSSVAQSVQLADTGRSHWFDARTALP